MKKENTNMRVLLTMVGLLNASVVLGSLNSGQSVVSTAEHTSLSGVSSSEAPKAISKYTIVNMNGARICTIDLNQEALEDIAEHKLRGIPEDQLPEAVRPVRHSVADFLQEKTLTMNGLREAAGGILPNEIDHKKLKFTVDFPNSSITAIPLTKFEQPVLIETDEYKKAGLEDAPDNVEYDLYSRPDLIGFAYDDRKSNISFVIGAFKVIIDLTEPLSESNLSGLSLSQIFGLIKNNQIARFICEHNVPDDVDQSICARVRKEIRKAVNDFGRDSVQVPARKLLELIEKIDAAVNTPENLQPAHSEDEPA